MPCSNCRRAQIPCIFPAPGRAPRRPRPKDPNAPGKQGSSERELELIKRLRKLEGIVEELSSQIEVESVRHGCSPGNSPEAVFSYARDENSIGVRMGSSGAGASHGSPNQGVATVRMSGRPTSGSVSEPDVSRKSPPDVQTVHKQFGRLVLNEKKGVTRYVSSTLWTSINDEVCLLAPKRVACADSPSLMNYEKPRKTSPTKTRKSRITRQPLRLARTTGACTTTSPSCWVIARPTSTCGLCILCLRKYPSYGRSTRRTSTQSSRSSTCRP